MTSSPFFRMTRASLISTRGLGDGIPANTYGQIGITCLSFKNSRMAGEALVPPLYLQFSPNRQALTSTVIQSSPDKKFGKTIIPCSARGILFPRAFFDFGGLCEKISKNMKRGQVKNLTKRAHLCILLTNTTIIHAEFMEHDR